MKLAEIPANEAARLAALQRYEVLDTPPEAVFDDFTALAAQLCDAPVALVSLVDGTRQWFKSRLGLDAGETPRDVSFCGHAIHQRDVFHVPDARQDERFEDNPLVTGAPWVRSYAGAPLITPDGLSIGTLCVIDRVPRRFTAEQLDGLVRLARHVMVQLEIRLANRRLARQSAFTDAILECAGSAVIATTTDGVVTHFNAAAERMLGYRSEEVLGKLDVTAFHDPAELMTLMRHRPDDVPPAAAKATDVLLRARTERPEKGEWTYVRKDGSRFPVLTSVIRLRDESGDVMGFLGIAQDLTERRRTEALQRTISAAAAGLLAAPSDQLDAAIDVALRTSGEQLGADRAHIFQLAEGGARLRRTHGWCAEGIAPRHEELGELPLAPAPRWWRRLSRGGMIVVSDVAGLPPGAAAERAMLARRQVRSLCAFPLQGSRQPCGVLCYEAVRAPRNWSSEELQLQKVMSDVVSSALARRRRDAALRILVESTAATVGEEFFQASVEGLARSTGARFALIATKDTGDPSSARTLAFWDTDHVGENFTYPLTHTPCDSVLATGICVYPDRAAELFPLDTWLVQNGIRGYAGVPVHDSRGEYLGHIAILDVAPLSDVEDIVSFLRLFAARAAGEMERRRAELALRESEENLAVTLDSIGDAVLSTEDRRRVTRLNPVAEKLTGWSQAEAVGRPVEEVFRVVDERTRQPATLPLDDLLATGAIQGLANHTLLLARDGGERQIVGSAAPIRDRCGRVIGVVLVFRDVTEEHAIQEALRTSTERLQFLLGSTGAVVFTADPESARGTYSSPNLPALWGYSVEESLQPGWWPGGLHPDDRERVLRDVGAFLAGPGDSLSQEYRFRHGDGRWRWLAEDVRLLPAEPGRPPEIVGVWTDVTERHVERDEAEARLREANESLERLVAARTDELSRSERRFRDLFEFAPDAIVMADGEGRITMLNQQAEAMFGYTREELVGRQVETLVPSDPGRHTGHRTGFLQAGAVRSTAGGRTDLRAVRKDGAVFPVDVSLGVLEGDGGDGVEVAAAIRDVSARARAEEDLRTSLREKEILLKEIHHRVKNNLQIISSLLSMQSDAVPREDAPTRELFEESIRRVRSMALIHERLYQSDTLARIDLGAYARGLASSLVASYGVTAPVKLVVDAEPVDLSVEMAVPCGLILNELLSNALKHAFKDGRAGELHVGVRSEADGGWSLSVRDTGPGLPPGFDPEKTTSLGLQLVVSLTRQLKGRLTYHGEGGTTFRLTFKELKRADHR